MLSEPSDPVERADKRREEPGSGDVDEDPDGAIEQLGHGSLDASLVPKERDSPENDPYRPEHDLVYPDTSPDSGLDHPIRKPSLGA